MLTIHKKLFALWDKLFLEVKTFYKLIPIKSYGKFFFLIITCAYCLILYNKFKIFLDKLLGKKKHNNKLIRRYWYQVTVENTKRKTWTEINNKAHEDLVFFIMRKMGANNSRPQLIYVRTERIGWKLTQSIYGNLEYTPFKIKNANFPFNQGGSFILCHETAK